MVSGSWWLSRVLDRILLREQSVCLVLCLATGANAKAFVIRIMSACLSKQAVGSDR